MAETARVPPQHDPRGPAGDCGLAIKEWAALAEALGRGRQSILLRAGRLADLHVLSAETVSRRLAYREPGLAVALVRVWRRTPPHRIVETPAMAGCRSWVDLADALTCGPAEPVLDDAAFEQIREALAERLGRGGG